MKSIKIPLIVTNAILVITILPTYLYYIFDNLINSTVYFSNWAGVPLIIFSYLALLMISVLSIVSILQLSKNKFNKVIWLSLISLIAYIFAVIPNILGWRISYGEIGYLSWLKCWFFGCSVEGSVLFTFINYLSPVQTFLLILNIFFALGVRKTVSNR
jgi:hypothetical protein